jgi:predicted Zn-dependent protease
MTIPLISSTGYLLECKTVGQVAGILAHEMAHLIARHGSEEITFRYFEKNIKLCCQCRGSKGENYGLSRLHEYEADHIGLMVISEAGFDPQHILDFMSVGMVREKEFLKGKEDIPELSRTHPSMSPRFVRTKGWKVNLLKDRETFGGSSKLSARSPIQIRERNTNRTRNRTD